MVLLSRLVCREFPQTFNSSKRPTVSAVSKEVSVLHAGAPVAFPFLVRIDSSACLTTALPSPSRGGTLSRSNNRRKRKRKQDKLYLKKCINWAVTIIIVVVQYMA